MTRDRITADAARVLSILASDPRWTLDEVSMTIAGRGWRPVRRVAWDAMVRAMVQPGMGFRELRAEAEARLRCRP